MENQMQSTKLYNEYIHYLRRHIQIAASPKALLFICSHDFGSAAMNTEYATLTTAVKESGLRCDFYNIPPPPSRKRRCEA
ncbi:MAG: hypothetical protein LBQ52_10305 [Helicobacteraceae bacterium]|jgi:hypothetical protein|nr:hypothetical protein [Helicobacteraceae bacterium]